MRQSRTRVDLPDPDGPEMQVRVPSGRRRVILFRLCLFACVKTSWPLGLPCVVVLAFAGASENHVPVGLSAFAMMS